MEIFLEQIYNKNLKTTNVKKDISNNIKKEEYKDFSIKNANNVTINDLINYKKMAYSRFNDLGYAILSYRGAGEEYYGKSSWYQIVRINYKCDEGEQILKNAPPTVDIYIKRVEENKYICYLIQTYFTGIRKVVDKQFIYISLNS